MKAKAKPASSLRCTFCRQRFASWEASNKTKCSVGRDAHRLTIPSLNEQLQKLNKHLNEIRRR